MISVIIPTLNCEESLAYGLASLVPAAADGVVREVIIVDGGSSDGTETIADAAGCEWVTASAGRGKRLAMGAEMSSRGSWLMFLPAGTVLESGWHHEVSALIERLERSGAANHSAAVFRLKLDAFGWCARLKEVLAMVRSRVLGMPYANQGLLISRKFYASLGGHRALPEMEDLDLVHRIGRSHIVFLRAAAISSGREDRAESGMAFRRAFARLCVTMLRLPPKAVLRLHGEVRQ